MHATGDRTTPLVVLAEQFPNVVDNPVVVYTAVASVAVYIAATGLAKVVGPLGEAIRANAEARQRHRQKTEDARIKDLSSQVDHLVGRVYVLETRQERQDALLLAHMRWDQEVLAACIQAGVDVTNPPPLRPVLDGDLI